MASQVARKELGRRAWRMEGAGRTTVALLFLGFKVGRRSVVSVFCQQTKVNR